MHVSVSTGTSHVPASKRPAYSDMNVSYRLQLSLFFRVHTSQYCTLMWVLEAVSNVCSHVTVLHADVGVGSSQ